MTAAERSRRYRARKAEKERPWREIWQHEERKQKRRAKDRERREKRREEEVRQWREMWRRHMDPEAMRQRQQHRKQAERQAHAKSDVDEHKQALMRKLTKVLGMLGSEHEGERAVAARQAEALRKELGMTWEEIASH